MSRIQDRRVLITGAASGVGRLLAHRLAALDAQLILVDVNEAGLSDVQREISAAQTVVADVSSPDDVAQLRSEVDRIDILINNAAVIATGAYLTVPASSDSTMLDVNVRGVHLLTKAFLDDLIASEDGHLVMMASVAALVGVPYQALYSATKWFVAGLGDSIRQELRVEGHDSVTVTIVCPSVIATSFYRAPKAPFLLPILKPEHVADRIVKAIRRDKPYVREPWMVKLIPLLKGILPTTAADATSRLFGVHRVVPREPE